MARFKNQNKGQKSVPKNLKKRLSTKRSTAKSADPSNQSIRERPDRDQSSDESNASSTPSSPYTARKSISSANSSNTPHSARKSISNQSSEPSHVARKSISNQANNNDSFEQSSSDSDEELLTIRPASPPLLRKIPTASQSRDKENAPRRKPAPKSRQRNEIPVVDDENESSGSTAEITASTKAPVAVKKTFRRSGFHMRPFDVPKTSHRRKTGVLALQQIRYYQKQTGLLIPKTNFQRLVREVLQAYTSEDYRIQSNALLALQEAAETRLVQVFEAGQLCAIHANRVTLMNRDFTLLKYFDN